MKSTARYNTEANRLLDIDKPAHDWYRFVLSYPAHLVRDYLSKFGLRAGSHAVVLDPFCGTGTTLVEAKRQGIDSIGIEANPMAAFAAAVKTDWNVDPIALDEHSASIATAALTETASLDLGDLGSLTPGTMRDLSEEQWKVLSRDFISPLPLHRALLLLERIETSSDKRFQPWERLALAKSLVTDIGNVRFGPEIGVGEIKNDAAVVPSWRHNCKVIAQDIALLNAQHVRPATTRVIGSDARALSDGSILPQSIDIVITSPPYPNEKDYTRTTRLESVVLGFISGRADLRQMKADLLRSNTRNVFVADTDQQHINDIDEIVELAAEIERRRISLGKTSGFERLYHKVTLHYFGGMSRHLSQLRPLLRPGARLAYVVGDQASYFQVMIRTGYLLGQVAKRLGYEVENIDLFRTRAATATRQQLREEVVILRWPG